MLNEGGTQSVIEQEVEDVQADLNANDLDEVPKLKPGFYSLLYQVDSDFFFLW